MQKEVVMNLDRVPAEKRAHFSPKSPPQATQVPLFPWLNPPESKPTSPVIEKALRQIAAERLFGRLHVDGFLRGQLRRNCRPSTSRTSFQALLLFLRYLKIRGCSSLSAVRKDHISGFVESEQDRGMAPKTIHIRLRCLYSFLRYLVNQEVVGADLLKYKLRIKVPDSLPRAIDPEDIQRMLAVLRKPREKALILTLLRTGMRIGELLETKVVDLNLGEKHIRIFEAQKNRTGRIVYLSSDAARALKKWLKQRKIGGDFIFSGVGGRSLSYETARVIFNNCIEKAGLAGKGYTLHSLRHTYATELLNAGMPLQCLQELLGHKTIEMTRRYARLSDNTRRKAYYRAMAIIEAGERDEHYRLDNQLP
jgi:site-specific recombinase XerD